MKIFYFLVSAMVILCITSSYLLAGTVEVKWTDPDSYRDIRSGTQHPKHFRKNTFNVLEKHLAKLADKLPQGQILKIDVTDVDLAGEIFYGNSHQLRVVKEANFPRMVFSYQLINADKTLATSGAADIKDMNFLQFNSPAYRNKALGNEKRLLDDWFKETFSESKG